MIIRTFFQGAGLGLGNALTPGPLMTLVILHTIRFGLNEGLLVAVTSFFADIPIILTSIVFASALTRFPFAMPLLSIFGGVFMFYLARGNFRAQGLNINIENTRTYSFQKGILSTLLNPHPYMFWITVGTPIGLRAWGESHLNGLVYFSSFQVFFVGTNLVLALITHRTKNYIGRGTSIFLARTIGICFGIFGAFLLWDGLKYFWNV